MDLSNNSSNLSATDSSTGSLHEEPEVINLTTNTEEHNSDGQSDTEEHDETEEEKEEGYDSEIPTVFISNNSNVYNNINDLQMLLNITYGYAMPTTIPSIPLNFVFHINPSNSGNSVLPPTTLTGNPINMGQTNNNSLETIDEEVNKLIIAGNENMHLVPQQVLNFIEKCFLENMQYDDDNENLIRYTIRNCFINGLEYELKELIAGIMYYSLMGLNAILSDNYDLLVFPMLQNELKRIVTQSLRLSILRRMVAPQQMEDVKLVVKQDVLDTIHTSKFAKLDDSIKSMNAKCTVCQDEFNGEDDVRVLKCNHTYHLDCIDGWLKEYSYKCPCCREPAAEHSAKM